MKCLSLLAGVLVIASSAAGQVTTTYEPTRDTFMRGGATTLHGSSANGRASKTDLDFYITDFDRQAIRSAIERELGHALTLADMRDVEMKWYLFSNDFQQYKPRALSRPAVFQGTQDWTEGTNATLGATKGYALWDPSNPGNNLQWARKDGTLIEPTDRSFNMLDKVENASFEEWGGDPFTYRAWALDDHVEYAYLTDPLSLGLFLNARADPAEPDINTQYSNTEVFSRETTNLSRRPYLEVTVVPEPAAVGLLAFATLALRRSRRIGRDGGTSVA